MQSKFLSKATFDIILLTYMINDIYIYSSISENFSINSATKSDIILKLKTGHKHCDC